MGYVSTETGPLNISSGRVLMLQQRAGLGDATTDILGSLDTPSSITGLPILWELGLGLLGVAFLLSYTGKGWKRATRRRRIRKRAKARKAALKAELAAI
jgi:hypothetical protein